MYKQLIKDKVRFTTAKGLLSLEQLFTLSINELDTLAVSLQEAYEKSNTKKSFIEKRTTKDKSLKMQLDVVLDIMQDKIEEAEVAKTKAENKLRNQKIREIIAEKKDAELASMSVSKLESLLVDED